MPTTAPRLSPKKTFQSYLRLMLALVILLTASGARPYRPPQTTIPVPQNVSATTGERYRIRISWDAVTHASLDHYEIRQDLGGGSSMFVAKVQNIGTLPGGYYYDVVLDDYNFFAYEDYDFFVKACPESQYYCDSASETVTGNGIIAPPYIFASSGTYVNKIEITFAEFIDESYRTYEVYRSDTVDGDYELLDAITTYPGASQENLFVDNSQGVYYYKGRICNDPPLSAENCSEMGDPAQGSTNVSPPGINASDGTSHTIDLSWDEVDGAIYYRLYRSTTGTAPAVDDYLHETVSYPSSTTFSDQGMAPYSSFNYWVRAYRGSTLGYTNPGDPDSGWRTYDTSKNISPSTDSEDAITVTWINSDDSLLDYYLVYRSETVDGTQETVGTAFSTSFVDTSAVPGQDYYYWVQGCDFQLRCGPLGRSLSTGVRLLGDPPTISAISDQATDEDNAAGPIPFTVSDPDGNPDLLVVAGTSNNTTLLPDANITFGGSGTDRTLTLTPAGDQYGTANVTITVSDLYQSNQTTFQLTVNPVNDPPMDLTLSSTTIAENEPIDTLVGSLTTTDADPGDSHTYVFGTGSGDTGNSSFTLDGSALRSGEIFDYETQDQYSILIEASDSGGESYSEVFLIDITDVDDDPPAVSAITRSDANPTNASSVDCEVTFSESVTGVDTADFNLTTSGLTGAGVSAVSGSGDTYTVTVDTGSGSGTLRLDITDDDSIQDGAGNPLGGSGTGNGNFTSGEEYTLDRDLPVVSAITRTDADPTAAASVDFSVTFNRNVSGVDAADFNLVSSGVSGASISTISGSDSSYTVSVDTGTGSGTLRLDLTDNDSISDSIGNLLGGAGTGNGDYNAGESYTIDRQAPMMTGTSPSDLEVLTPGLSQILVSFTEDVLHDGGGQAADNPGNYLLFQAGSNGIYDTTSCADYPAGSGDDVFYLVGPVDYSNHAGVGPYQAELTVNSGTPLPVGEYRLHICGSTSIDDLAGNTINSGTDQLVTFTIQAASLPATGFPPNRVTQLPFQAPDEFYDSYQNLNIEIPVLGINKKIVGIPLTAEGWDLTWLEGNIGWLAGTAYPGWAGNTALTAHAYNASGLPGPFVSLDQLSWGDEIRITAHGQRYIYQVRELDYARPDEEWPILTHEDYDWITLITCRGYDESLGGYRWRTVVRAVLTSVIPLD